MAEVPVRVGKRTKWISGLTEKTTCKVSGELIAGSRRFTSSLNAAAAAWSDFAQNRFPFEPLRVICKVNLFNIHLKFESWVNTIALTTKTQTLFHLSFSKNQKES